MYRSGKQPPKPELPFYADVTYWISFMLSIYFKDEKILHGIFSCLPLFMIVHLTLNRLVRGELGSTVMMLSLLAESIAHLFHQFAHDERFMNLYFFEHLICGMFLAMGNFIYVFEKRQKKEIFRKKKAYLKSKLPKPQSIIVFPIIASGFYLMLYETKNDNTNWILYYMKVFYSIPLTIQLIYAIQRYQATSKKSYFCGLAASIIYVLSDLSYQHFPLYHKLFHRFSLYLQTRQIFYHIKWFQKNRYKFE
ncbi:unnamed protein product (macronuclear) [Paramecium tetraurelia]|uniref:Uncharacterized protein n=2 Tax=Paramecium TaxID=5884 RepID=A0BJ91_PARTE|nr:uncharacterized protein GSPATT00004981001 [Paramecium tetraurelia]CAD8144281.1 unnamed protein product [Paramecium octaurelia]CAK58608.1 unnamed protein product [Paramecium tetraurelia]|eukprot:XP_001426006.1 hypothetical protein (macronuclear) [Paramecium tetraurelia strain d4-2]